MGAINVHGNWGVSTGILFLEAAEALGITYSRWDSAHYLTLKDSELQKERTLDPAVGMIMLFQPFIKFLRIFIPK